MDYHLQKLEKKSLDIIREAKDKFKNIAVLKLDDKESGVCLYLCKRAFFSKIPFPVLQLNNIEEIKKAIKEYNLEALIVSAKILDSVSDFENNHCLRIYPMSGWEELDIWFYIKENNIPIDKNIEEAIKKLQTGQDLEKGTGKKDEEKEEIMQRLRDLGYM